MEQKTELEIDMELRKELDKMDKLDNPNRGSTEDEGDKIDEIKGNGEKSVLEYQNKLQKLLSKEEMKKYEKRTVYDGLDEDNPYRDSSSLDLGKMKESFRWIETDVLLQLVKTKISSSEWSVFFYIFHLTRGYCNKKTKYYRTVYDFPIEEIQENTGLSESSVRRSIKSLLKKKMIYSVKERGVVYYGINFRYDTWVSNELSQMSN